VIRDLLRQGRTVRLHVFTNNVRARRFYERLGFISSRCVLVLVDTVATDPVERRMPSGDEVRDLKKAKGAFSPSILPPGPRLVASPPWCCTLQGSPTRGGRGSEGRGR
jgi:FR47-like protein